MTQARFQLYCKAFNVKIGYYKGKENYPRKFTERYKALYLYKDHFCLKWKSERISFNKTIEERNQNLN